MQLQRQQQEGEPVFQPVPTPGCHPAANPQFHLSGNELDRFLDILGSALKKDLGEPFEAMRTKQVLRKCKVYFCIGVNNVTRTLERMPHVSNDLSSSPKGDKTLQILHGAEGRRRIGRTFLQVVIVANDVHPRVLVSHFPDLAASRNVPLITLNGGNGIGSLRLGELFCLRTAIAVGLKVGNSESNKAMGWFLRTHS